MSDIKLGDLKLTRSGAQLIVWECVQIEDKRSQWKEVGYIPFNETLNGGIMSEGTKPK